MKASLYIIIAVDLRCHSEIYYTMFYIFACRIEKRAKYSRRRPFDSEADVDYINERNKKFNKKASRFYDQYTAEIKQNLERGTAV